MYGTVAVRKVCLSADKVVCNICVTTNYQGAVGNQSVVAINLYLNGYLLLCAPFGIGK